MSSSLIDRVAASIDAKLVEVPVGFKWFVDPLFQGEVAFGGEASFRHVQAKVARVDHRTRTCLIPDLLAAEITAKTGKNPAQLRTQEAGALGESQHKRVDTPEPHWKKEKFAKLIGDDVRPPTTASITAKLTEAPGNHAKIGG